MNQITKGYKVTDANMQCRGYQFSIGDVFTQTGELEICVNGFHFCQKASHCFNYYGFDRKNRVFEIEAYGDIQTKEDKSCALQIKFIREISWEDVLTIVNEGIGNTGHSNTGDCNTGDCNTGDCNTGDCNTGDCNTGYCNTGNGNTGNWNTGNWNTGYSNTGNWNTGAFCTGDAPFPMFNKPSSWTEQDFINSKAYSLLCNYVNTKLWIPASAMTDAEKEANPSYKTAEGYLKDIPFKESFKNAWHNWSEENRAAFTSLPNFDPAIFEEITGVRV